MKTTMTIEITIEHDGSSTNQEMADALEMLLEQHNTDNPDDFGITKCVVDKIFINPDGE